MEAKLARQREKSTRALYAFSREIAAVVDVDIIVRNLADQSWQTLELPVAVFLPQKDDKLVLAGEAGAMHIMKIHIISEYILDNYVVKLKPIRLSLNISSPNQV